MTNFFDSFSTRGTGDVRKLSVLMTTAFIDMVGGLMVFPLFPFYATKFGANGFEVSLLITAFAVMQLLSAPFWGKISDKYGRKPALLAGLIGSAISYVVFAYANSYWMLLVCRLVQGAGGGTTGVIQAYVADAVEPKNRARGLGWLSSATNLGVVLGPLVGAQAMLLGEHGPGLIAALLCLVNIWFAVRYLTERQTASAREKSKTARPAMEIVARVFTHPGERASRLIWMYAICMGAFYGINPTLSLYLKDYWGVTALTIGYFFAYIGAISVVVRVFLVGPVVDRLGEVRTARMGTALLALGILTVVLVPPLNPHGAQISSFADFENGWTGAVAWGLKAYWPLALAVALIPLGTAFNFPATTGLLSRVVDEHERGLYMGVQQTYAGIARAIYPMYAGLMWDRFPPLVPFGTSAALVAGTIWLGYGLNKYEGHTEEIAIENNEEEPPVLAEERR